jgi:putative FmdB family regulatory protein
MAVYEFRCQKCRKDFELTLSFDDYDRRKGKIKCPKCRSSKVGRRITSFEVQTSRKT